MVSAILLMLCLLINDQMWPVWGMTIPHPGSGGGTMDGDPAPGRSPGPPVNRDDDDKNGKTAESPFSLEDENPTMVLTVSGSELSCDFERLFKSDEYSDGVDTEEFNKKRERLNLTVEHYLFRTDVGLVEGLQYEVSIFPLNGDMSAFDLLVTSFVNGLPRGQFHIQDEERMSPTILLCHERGSTSAAAAHLNAGEHVRLNWTMPILFADISNVTFRLHYQIEGKLYTEDVFYNFTSTSECKLYLRQPESNISWSDIPARAHDCELHFPLQSDRHGLLVDLNRLNIQCSSGSYIKFATKNASSSSTHSLRNRNKNHIQTTRLCGKLEELEESDRRLYFTAASVPVLHLHELPIFSLTYRLVDFCYNVTLTDRNGTMNLEPSGRLECTFKIHLPYGNRIALKLQMGPIETHSDSEETLSEQLQSESVDYIGDTSCHGLLTRLTDGISKWSHCAKTTDPQRNIEIMSRENSVVLRVDVTYMHSGVGLKIWYHAEPVTDVVRQCAFGWVAVRQFCVSAVDDMKLTWHDAEMECERRGGHLASISSEQAQDVVDSLLVNSPGYRDHNAYWIGASDQTYEGDFRWSDGLSFTYTNWFPGWNQHGHYNRQPNDDGLSDQDCVEVRRAYHLPAANSGLAASFHWNDRDCSTLNHFLCERLMVDEPLDTEGWPPATNRSVTLTRSNPRVLLTSPGFPRPYPDNVHFDTDVTAPHGFRIVLDFDELILENEPHCSYDFLEIIEMPYLSTNPYSSTMSPSFSSSLAFSSFGIYSSTPMSSTTTHTISTSTSLPRTPRRICGDWSAKLKLLRHVSIGSHLKLRFVSDYSHHFSGFKARVSMENAMECADERLHMFNQSCYLFVSYPQVTWFTAQQICKGIRAHLASIVSPEEERFVTSNIRRTSEYSANAIFWLGGKVNEHGKHEWMDGSSSAYSGWLPGHGPEEENEIIENPSTNPMCLGIQWTTATSPMLSSGLYWHSQKCHSVGGYVCKRRYQFSGINSNFNRTINGSDGRLTSPNYPGNYYHNLDYWIKIVGPRRTRLIVQFARLDIESQIECLYDYVELRSTKVSKNDDSVRWCGTHDTDMERFNFVSLSNEVLLRFHSDYSLSGSGFSATWQAIDVSSCPVQTLTAREGTVTSPNYPHFLLPGLDCTVTILAPPDKRIWLEIVDYDLDFDTPDADFLRTRDKNTESIVELDLDELSKPFRPFQVKNHLTDGAYVSQSERIKIRLRTATKPYGSGFKAIYKAMRNVREERVVNLENSTHGTILNLNYPMTVPPNVDYTQHFVAPLGSIILLELYHVKFNEKGNCPNDNGILEVIDNYAEKNGTKWYLCEDIQDDVLVPPSPLSITSYLNTLHIRQKSSDYGGVTFNGTVRVQPDVNYKVKLLRQDDNMVESCDLAPCQNNGKCVGTNDNKKTCQCIGHFTGLFCALTVCELAPCVFGRCELTHDGHRCVCQPGYAGLTCEQKKRPCDGSPCEGRGECVERGDTFQCRCHAWWEGTRCERRMVHIPYKPLSERMLQEPFWLGLITVTVVLGVIAFVWCAKRHFPEKLEKLLAEEADRNRGPTASIRGSSIRDQLGVCGSGPGGGGSAMVYAASGASGTGGHQGSGGACPRSLFGRLGIRKPSLLSLTSPHSPAGSHHHHPSAAARTFSLDDLLKPPLRRTPSPRKKRNNSTPTKKNAAEKKQILQQLISPATNQQLSRKVSLGELIQLTDRKMKENEAKEKDEHGKIIETNFGGTVIDPSTSSLRAPLDDPKLEKKVTFARLLNKVSAEMSSGSEIELTSVKKSVSSPPSPATDPKSPHSTSSNQGSDSLSSLEVSIPGGTGSITDLLSNRRNGRIVSGRVIKPASADSILAMFRNFSSTSAGANMGSSVHASPSSTPTASSPQDDAAGDDDSPTSSIHTPISFSSGPPDSPVMFTKANSHSIEVPVLDPLNAHKTSMGGNNFLQPPTILLEIPSSSNKCLSPIRELPTPLPTPMPSPAITPMRQRSPICSSNEDLGMDMSDDRISIELPCMSISLSDADDDEDLPQDIIIDIQAADGLLQDETLAMSQAACSLPVPLKLKTRPPPIGQILSAATSGSLSKSSEQSDSTSSGTAPPPPLIIPTLTIQTPSPTHRHPPSLIYPGSPPPQRTTESYDSEFSFPMKQQRRGLLKEFDKPTSLDLPCVPPMITITCNLSEAESDAESISPAVKTNASHLGAPSGGMSYLSPFSMCTRADRTTSESNLSSSGYSSMASPGPSRCGSNNPLCPSEMEDPGPPGSGATGLHSHITPRRPSPLLKNSSANDNSTVDRKSTDQGEHCRGRSDSETLSDDPLLESNDEGIGTDHLDEKIEDGDLKSAKELEVFIGKDLLDNGKTLLGIPVISTPSLSVTNCGSVEEGMNRLLPPLTNKTSLQLPAIVVQGDLSTCDKLHPSPVSSRSESPLSDRTAGLGQFSPQFYNRYKDQLPFTDSDGLYDFPSSDCPPPHNSKVNVGPVVQQHRKSTGRRRDKKTPRIISKTQSPTKPPVPSSLQHLLDIPGKEQHFRMPTQRKPSPKRRARTQQRVSSSSSSESLNSMRELKVSSSSPSPDTIRWPATTGDWPGEKKACVSTEASGEETGEDASNIMIPTIIPDDVQKPHKKISRLRTISHQIRFLRRLEQSLKKRERLVSLSDSIDSGGDEDNMSPRATSPLLQSQKQPLPEIRKSSSISRLQGTQPLTTKELRPSRNSRYKKSGSHFSIPQDDRKWTRVPVTGNGFSD